MYSLPTINPIEYEFCIHRQAVNRVYPYEHDRSLRYPARILRRDHVTGRRMAHGKEEEGRQTVRKCRDVHRELAAPAGLDDHAPTAQQYCYGKARSGARHYGRG